MDFLPQLSKQQRCFVEEYLIDLNATQAAIRAGYSFKTARQQGQRLLTNAYIKEAIAESMNNRSRRTEIKQDDVIRELACMAYLNPADCYERDSKGRLRLKDIDQLPEYAARAIKKIKQNVVEHPPDEEGGEPVIEVFYDVEFHGKTRPLELIGKHLGMFQEKTSADVGTGTDKADELFKDVFAAFDEPEPPPPMGF